MPRNGNFADFGAKAFQHLGRGAHAGVDIGMRIVLSETFLHHADLEPGYALPDRLGVSVDLQAGLPGVVAVVAGHHFKEQRVLGGSRGERPGMIDRRVHAHDAGIGNKTPGRLDADDAGERCRNPDRAGLIAAGRHIDFAGGDERAGAGRGAARGVAPRARIVNGPGRTGRRAAREREIFANRFADDFRAGIEEARDDGRVELRYKTLQHRRPIGQRNAGDCVSVFDRYFLTRELAARRALDVRLHDPGAVFIFVALRPIISATRVFDRRHIIRQRSQQAETRPRTAG